MARAVVGPWSNRRERHLPEVSLYRLVLQLLSYRDTHAYGAAAARPQNSGTYRGDEWLWPQASTSRGARKTGPGVHVEPSLHKS